MHPNHTLAPVLPAEWEPQDAVILAWPHAQSDWLANIANIQKTYIELIRHITRFESVVLLIPDQPEKIRLQSILLENQIAVDKVIPVFANYNDTWLRDTGPVSIKVNTEIHYLDFRFNGWGNKFEHQHDDQLCKRLFEHFTIQPRLIEQFEIILEGGSIDSDGNGALLTTEACLLNPNRNPTYSKDDYNNLFSDKLGVDNVHWLKHGHIIGDDTDGHIDMLARFCSANTIAYSSCDDRDDPHYESLNSMKAELENLITADKDRYHLIDLPIPAAIYNNQNERLAASYCNFLVINDAVLVPVYDDPNDTQACEKLEACFPGREIIPINALNIIQQGGSLHCLTMQLPAGSLNR